MPEELIIALVLIFIAGWLLFALLRGLFKVVGDAHETAHGLLAKRRAQRFERRKAELVGSVRIVLPSQLARAELELRRLDSEFQMRRAASKWVAKRPAWEKKPF